MDGCSLYALIACFSWSNLYLDGGLIAEDVRYVERAQQTMELVSAPRNPLGRSAMGYEIRMLSMTLSIEAAHVSSLRTSADRGVNSISLNARWYPFRQ